MMRSMLALVVMTGVVHADSDAERLYKEGQAAYDDKRYDDAIAAWDKAYALSKLPGLVFNLAQAHRLANHCEKAVDAYKRFLALDPQSDERPSAEQFLKELEPCKKATPKPIDYNPAKPDGVLPSALGSYRIEDRGGGKRTFGLITGGAGIALFATGLYFGNRATSIANEVEEACAMGCEWSTLEDKDASGRSAATLQYVFLGTGAAAIATGTVLYLLGARARETMVMIETPPGGAVVGVSGHF
jgi:tetratricopeptide (TPR) repeat protein